MHDVVKLTKDLCAIESVTKNERAVCEFVAAFLENEGYIIEQQTLPGSDRSNILAYLKSGSPKILLTTHLDTVPPYFPVTTSDDGEWLVGRGVCDAKGIAAAMICAALNLRDSGLNHVGLLFVVGEETNSDGAKWAAQVMTRTFDFVINGEPTDLKLASSMKGALVFEMTAQGRAGHSAYPDSGHSALHQLIGDASKLLESSWPQTEQFGETTVNIGTFKGGEAPNVIAPAAKLGGVARLTCSVEEAKSHISKLVDPKTSVEIFSESAPRELHTVSGFEVCNVAYGCDIPHLEKLGTPLLFGPGSILDAHTSHERVRIKDLHKAVLEYERLCTLLSSEK